jgi:hypothetical protein
MKNKWFRKLLGGLSLTSVLFVFQACYGTPQDFGLDIFVEGKIVSKKTRLPVQNIKVSVKHTTQYVFSDEQGLFSLYTEPCDSLIVCFDDVDSTQNGLYANVQKVFTDPSNKIYVDAELDILK